MSQEIIKPKISIIVPVCNRPDKEVVLKRCLDSIKKQSFKDYEIIMPENGKGWSANHNEGIKQARGELIKFLHMDDFFANEKALQETGKIEGAQQATAKETEYLIRDYYKIENSNPKLN